MVATRSLQKVERVTLTLHPEPQERLPMRVPTTFDANARTYGWKHSSRMNYMIVPRKISSSEIKVDLFITAPRGGRMASRDVQKLVQSFVQAKIASEWRGLVLGEISRPTAGVPPTKSIVRGTIEDMLGVSFKS
jgi:hypothetical protein